MTGKKWLARFLLLSLSVVALLLTAERAAIASGEIGLIDSQKMMFQHPRFDDTIRILLFLSRTMAPNQMVLITQERDAETRRLQGLHIDLILEFIELDRVIANERDPARRSRLTENRQERLEQVEARMMTPIIDDCQRALETVAAAKNMAVVMEIGSTLAGGTEITEEVIQEIKRIAR